MAHTYLWFRGRPCPYKDINWEYSKLAPGDSIHDICYGRCTVCGAEHVGELGRYGREVGGDMLPGIIIVLLAILMIVIAYNI